MLLFAVGILVGVVPTYWLLSRSGPGEKMGAVTAQKRAMNLRLSKTEESSEENGGEGRSSSKSPSMPQKGPKIFEDIKVTSDRLIQEGKTKEAIQELQAALADSPGDPRLKTELGFAFVEDGQIDQAKQVFEKKLAENPDDPEAYLGLGVVDRVKGSPDAALVKLNEALSRDPNNPDAKFNMAEILAYERGDGGTVAEKYLAERFYNELLEQNSSDPDLQNGLASVYLSSGRTDRSVGIWEKMVQEHPDESVLYSNLGEAYVKSNRPDDAIAVSQKALERDPNNSDAYFFMGQSEIAKGNQQQGVDAIRKAAELEPDNKDYQKKLKELGVQ